MTGQARVGLAAFAVCLGEAVPLSHLDDVPPPAREVFLADDLQAVRVSDRTPVELACEALSRTLGQANGRNHPDGPPVAVVWASTSFHIRSWYTDDISAALVRLGLPHADVVGVTLAECGNLGPALAVARDLVTARGRPAALVCTDVVRPPVSRVVAPNAALLSDGAGSCLVTPSGGEVILESIATVSNHLLRQLDPDRESVRVLRITARGIGSAARAALGAAGLAAADVDALLVPHHNRSVRALYVQQCGVAGNRVRAPGPAHRGHLFAADVLADLQDVVPELGGDAVVLAMVAGTSTWTGMVFRTPGTVQTAAPREPQ